CDGLDNDCDKSVDDNVSDATTWYLDVDGDGFGVSSVTTEACEEPEGYATVSGDCDDKNPTTYPGAPEPADGIDHNCDGTSELPPTPTPSATPTEPTATPTGPTATPTEPTATPTEPTATPTGPTATPTEPTATPKPEDPTPTPKPDDPTPTPKPEDPTATPTAAPSNTPDVPSATPDDDHMGGGSCQCEVTAADTSSRGTQGPAGLLLAGLAFLFQRRRRR
ncbi:MAG: putative metal-binding motif-containing protein, partial [Myxococcota bacterium]